MVRRNKTNKQTNKQKNTKENKRIKQFSSWVNFYELDQSESDNRWKQGDLTLVYHIYSVSFFFSFYSTILAFTRRELWIEGETARGLRAWFL